MEHEIDSHQRSPKHSSSQMSGSEPLSTSYSKHQANIVDHRSERTSNIEEGYQTLADACA